MQTPLRTAKILDLTAVVTPAVELEGGQLEVSTPGGPGGRYVSKRVSVEQLNEIFGGSTPATPLAPAAARLLAAAAPPAAQLRPGQLYVLTPRVDAANQPLPDMRIRAASETQLEPQGLLMQVGGPVLVSYDLATDTTSAFGVDAYTKAETNGLLLTKQNTISGSFYADPDQENNIVLPREAINKYVTLLTTSLTSPTIVTLPELTTADAGARIVLLNRTLATVIGALNETFSLEVRGRAELQAVVVYGTTTKWVLSSLNANPFRTPLFRGNWKPKTNYVQYDIVINGGVAYYSNSFFTSNTTFNVNNWSPWPVGGGTGGGSANTAGQNIAIDAAGAISTRGVFRGAWVANTFFPKNDEILSPDGYERLAAIADFTSGAAFDATKWKHSGAVPEPFMLPLSSNGNVISTITTGISRPVSSSILDNVGTLNLTLPPARTGLNENRTALRLPPGDGVNPVTITWNGCTVDGQPTTTFQPGDWKLLVLYPDQFGGAGISKYTTAWAGNLRPTPTTGTGPPAPASGGIDYANPVLHHAAATLTATDCGKHHVFQGTGVALWQVALPDPATCQYKLLSIQIGNSASGLWALQSPDIDGASERRMWARETATLWSTGTGWRKLSGRTIPLRAKIGQDGSGNLSVGAGQLIVLALPTLVNATVPAMTAASATLTVPRAASYQVAASILAGLTAACSELDMIIAVNDSYVEARARTALLSSPGFGSGLYFLQPQLSKPIPFVAGERVSLMLFSTQSYYVDNRAASPSYIAELEIVEEPNW